MHVSELWIYPVKSLSGIRLAKAEICLSGFRHDRQWMLVDSEFVFVTQRQLPEMALIRVDMMDQGFFLSDRQTGQGVLIPFESDQRGRVQVRVWNDSVLAYRVSDEADVWLSRFLKKDVQIVSIGSNNVNERKTRFGIEQEAFVRFADDFPYHLTTQASLDELNSKLEHRVEMMRFRPNIVVSDSLPFAEDAWRQITVGGIVFDIASPCKRCAVVNVNPESGVKERQPLKALSVFRREGYQIYFGLNVVTMQEGFIEENDSVVVLG